MNVPVITIDGPSASGKGTVAKIVAQCLGFHYLDSGAIYRICALHARDIGVDWANPSALSLMAKNLPVEFRQNEIWLNHNCVTEKIRSEQTGNDASIIAGVPAVRNALLTKQRNFLQVPGLVADGRDMGTVVFPHATLKVFLFASAEERAKRRYKQLMDKGESANLAGIKIDIDLRDARDAARQIAPLKPAQDAHLLDTTEINAQQAANLILEWYKTVE